MDKVYPSKTLMAVRALEKDTGPFWPRQEGEEVLCFEYPYLSAIEALMYLTNNIRPNITFAVNLLAGYSVVPTMCHWNGVKDILRYLQGTPNLCLFYQKIRFWGSLAMSMLDI
jgi:hypothetical protein